jgi:PPOX class probable F420-dependent enzyme
MESILGYHMNDLLIQFNNQLYLNLMTYRKNGEAMRTPVWFVKENNILFVRTIMKSGKVKRIRNNPNVQVALCEADGRITGQWLEGYARLIADPSEAARIEKLFDEKYGDVKKGIDEQRKAQGLAYATIAVEV